MGTYRNSRAIISTHQYNTKQQWSRRSLDFDDSANEFSDSTPRKKRKHTSPCSTTSHSQNKDHSIPKKQSKPQKTLYKAASQELPDSQSCNDDEADLPFNAYPQSSLPSSPPPLITSQYSQYSTAMLANSDLEPTSQGSLLGSASTTQAGTHLSVRTISEPNYVLFKVQIASGHHIQLSTTVTWNSVWKQFRRVLSLYGTDDPGPDALYFLQSPADPWPKLIGNSSIYTKWVSRIVPGTIVRLTVVSSH